MVKILGFLGTFFTKHTSGKFGFLDEKNMPKFWVFWVRV